MKYSQLRAMWAITRGSLRSISRSPSAVVFSFLFPFIFILVFGFIGNSGGMRTYKVYLEPNSDTNNIVYKVLRQNTALKFTPYNNEQDLKLAQQKGQIAGTIQILKSNDPSRPYDISLKSTTASNDQWPQVKNILDNTINILSDSAFKGRPAIASMKFDPATDVAQIRAYKTIDFILPGQLGFSLLSAGVFGVAFMFFNLRNQLVLKRFFATPIDRTHIVLGEALSRVIFQMFTAVIIILAGHLFFGFTLVHGVRTFLEMLFLSFIGLLVFMGFGFIVSGVAKNESAIPPMANIFTLPQFLLAGTFFSITAFPSWLQPIARVLPLTHLNDAMRKVAFEGAGLWDVKLEIGVLLLWGIVAYFFAVKLFKWE